MIPLEIKRIGFDILLFGMVFLFPWYWAAVLAIIGLMLFKKFWEIIIVGLLIDSLYSLPNIGLIGRFGIFTISIIVLFFIAEAVKKQIRVR